MWLQNPSPMRTPNTMSIFGVRAQDNYALTWNAGILIEPPTKQWAIGASYQPPITFDGKGNMYADFTESFWYENGLVTSGRPEDNDVTIDVTMPPILRTGALVRPNEDMEIEFAYVWQGWSNLESLTVRDINLPIETSISDEPTMVEDDIVLPTGFVNAHSYRLGFQYDVIDSATIRVGGNYETSAVQPQTSPPTWSTPTSSASGLVALITLTWG